MTVQSGNPRSAQPEMAPGDLSVVEAFLNTVDLRKGVDQLGSPRALTDWLAAARLLTPGIEMTAADLERALKVRESLRSVLAAKNGGRPPVEAGELLDQAIHEAHLRVCFGGEGVPRLEPTSSGLDAALGQIVGFVTLAHADGHWLRFKACANPRCQTAFYDRSSNRAAKWCTPRCCNRANARFYR